MTASAGRPLSDADYQALARFRYALRRFLRFSEDAARKSGMTPAQHQLLLAVRGFEGDGPPSVSDVAEALQLRPHSALELVVRAETHGLLRRGADPRDHRRTLLRLTGEGERHLAALTAQHRAELRRFRAEMAELLRILDP
ncbi:MAG: MarR family transcriptional regulator [Actinobacteria bacterium]|nr:MarR family transcriptional regulator [Actinomycetota bacterium]